MHTNTCCFVTSDIRQCTVCTVSKRQNLTDESVHKDEEEREEDEARVPHPDCFINGRDAKEHKDDGF